MDNKKTEPACVLFSGGADSTLAAVVMLEEHTPVHLLSFKHHHMSQVEKTSSKARELIAKYGPGRVVHQWLDMSSLWRGICQIPPRKSLLPKGIFALLLKPCLACKAAMHLLTLSYCQDRGIAAAADGAHPGGARLFPEQLPEGIQVLRDFYRRHGIDYQNPVYEVERPDFQLYEKGVTAKRNTKDEHIYYSNQFACHVGLLAYVHHFLSLPFDRKKNKTIRASLDFLEQSLKDSMIPGPEALAAATNNKEYTPGE
jgi:hypothetical protein